MPTSTVPDFVRDELAQLEITLPDAALDTLAAYLDALLEVNQQMNLTAIREREAAWRRLIIDSLTVLPGLEDMPAGAKVLDVGTGGGLPGVPIAVARPDLRVVMIDSVGKKVNFINAACARLGITNAKAIQDRAELIGRNPAHRQQYDVAVCRAMGGMSVVLECCMPLVQVGGRLLAMKGPKAEEELIDASDAMDKLGVGDVAVIDAYPESFGNDLVIVSFVKDRPTPKAYPREPGMPKRAPL